MNKNIILPLIGTNFITWHLNGRQLSITSKDARFQTVKDLLMKRDYENAALAFDKPAMIARFSSGKISIVGSELLYNGEKVHGKIAERIIDFVDNSLPFEPLVEFLKNMYENTDKRVRDALYEFIETYELSITSDGAFICYKLVQEDGRPIYHDNGKYVYKVGEEYSMPRPTNVCFNSECGSEGFYVGSKTYWSSSAFDENNTYKGNGLMLVAKVYPQDVISVPKGASKICVCKFSVISEYANVKDNISKPLFDKQEKKVSAPIPVPANVKVDTNKYTLLSDDDIVKNGDEVFYANSWQRSVGSVHLTVKKAKHFFGYDLAFRRKIVENKVVNNTPRRDSKGRFLKKNAPKRDSKGRFV